RGRRHGATPCPYTTLFRSVRAGKVGSVPPHLRDGHYAGAERLGHAQGYRYPHNVPEGVVEQQYPPDGLVGRDYYHPTERGAERPDRKSTRLNSSHVKISYA